MFHADILQEDFMTERQLDLPTFTLLALVIQNRAAIQL